MLPVQHVEQLAGEFANCALVTGAPPKIVKLVKLTGKLKLFVKTALIKLEHEHNPVKVITGPVEGADITKLPVGEHVPLLSDKL